MSATGLTNPQSLPFRVGFRRSGEVGKLRSKEQKTGGWKAVQSSQNELYLFFWELDYKIRIFVASIQVRNLI